METERVSEEGTRIPAFQLFHHFRSHKVEKKFFNVKPVANVYWSLYMLFPQKKSHQYITYTSLVMRYTTYTYLVTKYTMFTLIYIGIFFRLNYLTLYSGQYTHLGCYVHNVFGVLAFGFLLVFLAIRGKFLEILNQTHYSVDKDSLFYFISHAMGISHFS